MNRNVVLILATAFFAFAVWKSCHRDNTPVIPTDSTESEEPANSPVHSASDPAAASSEATTDVPTPPVPSAPIDMAAVRTRFAAGINMAGSCLGLSMTSGGDQAEPLLDNWMSLVKPELGEPVLQSEDKNITDITTPSGEQRQIRVEMDYTGEDRIVRRVKYMRFLPGGGTETIPLTGEQAEEPSETFLASLEADGQVVKREKSQRIYFSGGEEIVVTEKDGRIADIEMTRNGRSFRCRPEDSGVDACHCL